MTGDQPKPDLTLVTLIHQALRADAARLAAIVTSLDPRDQPGRLPGIRAYFDQYRGQLVMHHNHEDELFFPALETCDLWRCVEGKLRRYLAGPPDAHLDSRSAAEPFT